MSEHMHSKVYSGERLLTLVPQWYWICADCKATGADPIPSETPPPLDMPRYLDLFAVNDPDGAAKMRKTLAQVASRCAALKGSEMVTIFVSDTKSTFAGEVKPT